MTVSLAKRTDRPGVSLAKPTDPTGAAPLTTIAGVPLAKTPRPFFVLIQDGAVLNVATPPADAAERVDAKFELEWVHCLDVREVTAVDGYAAHTRVARELTTV
ncbi:hypothetical protein [Streptomyces sp. NPDC001635]